MKVDLLLRGSGFLLIAIAVVTGHALFGSAGAGAGWLALMLAVVTFMSASGGCALMVVGGHVFDQVTISARWIPGKPDRRPWDVSPLSEYAAHAAAIADHGRAQPGSAGSQADNRHATHHGFDDDGARAAAVRV